MNSIGLGAFQGLSIPRLGTLYVGGIVCGSSAMNAIHNISRNNFKAAVVGIGVAFAAGSLTLLSKNSFELVPFAIGFSSGASSVIHNRFQQMWNQRN